MSLKRVPLFSVSIPMQKVLTTKTVVLNRSWKFPEIDWAKRKQGQAETVKITFMGGNAHAVFFTYNLVVQYNTP